jgi:branched-chain amino acid transport system substrate-binding protein
VRDALENLGAYEGLIRTYDPPFRPDHHDALTAADFRTARYGQDGTIIPIRPEE